jgi:hypothetical protein
LLLTTTNLVFQTRATPSGSFPPEPVPPPTSIDAPLEEYEATTSSGN